jgi:membrane fusion protein (multidrug efflux system)
MKRSDLKHRILRWIWGFIPWCIVAVIVVLIVMFGVLIKEKQTRLAEAKEAAMKKDVPAIKVITLTLEPRRVEDMISLPGEVEPHEELWVKAEVTGQVMQIPVKEGQYVKKGQLLAKLDDRDYRSRVARIEANYKLAKVDHDRIESLAERNITARSKLDEAVAHLAELAAQYREAKLALSRTRITAPISGRLNELKAKEGDLLTMSKEVAQIIQIKEVKVTVGVPESDVAAVLDLDGADVVIEALDNRRVHGEKIFLSRKPRTLARLYDLELLVPNTDGKLLPGMFARVELVKKVFPEALAIPLYAVISQNKDQFVYVDNQGVAEKRKVTLGVLSGWEVQVTSGLTPGDRVVVVGHRFLDQGQALEVIKNVTRPADILAS